MRDIDDTQPPDDSVPDVDFWENELEMPVRYWLHRSEDKDFMNGWIAKLKGPQVAVLHALLDLLPADSTHSRRDDLRNHSRALKRFVPASRFARSKSRVAVVDFSKTVLDPVLMDVCQNTKGEFDVPALLFAVFDRDWRDLPAVFHLDKIHKSGFARMILEQPPKRPDKDFGTFLDTASLAAHLARFDREKKDGRASQLKNIIPHDGRYLVFLRRAERHDMLLQSTTVVHGYAPEWIILDFQEAATRVNISSKSVSVPLEIANHIASAYFGKEVEYVNDRERSYIKQIQRLLDLLSEDQIDELRLVEIAVDNGPLDSAPKIVLSRSDGTISDSLRHFKEAVGNLLDDVGLIDRIKVSYQGKRLTLKFEPDEENDNEYIVRYTDHTLNEKERRRFEAFMSETHGITILSTEKRYRR